MSKNLLAKYYQGNKERLQKAPERYQNLSKQKKKKKSDSIVINVTKISQKVKYKIFLSIERNIIE